MKAMISRAKLADSNDVSAIAVHRHFFRELSMSSMILGSSTNGRAQSGLFQGVLAMVKINPSWTPAHLIRFPDYKACSRRRVEAAGEATCRFCKRGVRQGKPIPEHNVVLTVKFNGTCQSRRSPPERVMHCELEPFAELHPLRHSLFQHQWEAT